MHQNLQIREATEEDIPAILSLYRYTLDKGDVITLDNARQIFRKMKQYPNYKVYLATIEEQAVGTFALLIMDNLAHMGTPSGIVEDVAVNEAFQNQGIGRQMMQLARELCREAGCYKLILSSNQKRTNAHAFYESLGFEKHGFSFLVQP